MYPPSRPRICSRARESSDSTALAVLPIRMAIDSTESPSTYFPSSTSRRSTGSSRIAARTTRIAFHLFQHVLGQNGDVSQFGRLPELIAKRRGVPSQSTAAVVQGNSLAGNAEQPVPETALGCITLVDSVQRFQPSLLVQVFRDRSVAPNKVENKAVDLVKMAIDSGTPGGAVALLQNRNQAGLFVVGHARSLVGSRVLTSIFAREEEILRSRAKKTGAILR